MGVERSLDRRAVMREVNDRILEINDEFHSKEPVVVVCECCRSGCAETIRIGRSVYERARKQPGRYAVLVGHEDDGGVVERRSGYVIVDGAGG